MGSIPVKLAAVLLCLVVVASFVACTKAQPTAQSENTSRSRPSTQGQNATLPRSSGSSRGTTSPAITVSSYGIIAAANYANLYFGTGGKIEKISVGEGVRVSKGTVLAKLDTTSLEVTLAQAKVALSQAKSAQTQAKINLETAQFTRDKTKAVSNINNKIVNLQWEVKIAEMLMPSNPTYWTQQIAISQQNLADETRYLSALLGKTEDAEAVAHVAAEYDSVTIKDATAKELQVELARQTADKSQDTVDSAQKSLTLAQQQLDEATIIAPFDGIVATINYKEGDVVPTPAQSQRPIVYLIDPATMKLNIGVNELDIPKVNIDQRVSISIDAFPSVKLEGKVAAISPGPTVQGGMADYNVAVTFPVPSNMRVRAGMNATAQIGSAEAQPSAPPNTQPSTQSENISRSRPSTQGQNATLPRSSGSSPRTTSSAITVSSYGIIAAANYANLYFGTGGKVEKISVKEGDRVSKGTVLAKLDTASLEVSLAQAKVALDQAKLAQTQAKTNLEAAQFTLDKTKTLSDIKEEIINLQWQLKVAEMEMPSNPTSSRQPATSMQGAMTNIATKTKQLSTLLGQAEYTGVVTYDILGEKYDTLVVEDIGTKELQVELARQTVDKSQDTVELTQKSLTLAQQQFDGATIIAPFDGIVATMNYREGDVVPAPAQSQRPIVYLIDPTTMELNIGVNELDAPEVNIGQRASISIDAFPGVKLEGKVAAISLVPTVQSGIVDYKVTITFPVPSNMQVRVGMNAMAQITVK